MGSSILDEDLTPIDVKVDSEMIRVRFNGGLELATPVSRFPRLRDAAPERLVRWELVGCGDGIHWPDVDEDISVRGLFAARRKMPESPIEQIPVLISDLLKTTGRLNNLFNGTRPFTPDGHLVGSIGEVVAEYIYDLSLEPCSTQQIDAYTKEEPRRSVQVKLTGSNGSKFGIRWPVQEGTVLPEILLCLRMKPDGFEEIYNGYYPTSLLQAKSRTLNGQVSLGLATLSEINPRLLPVIHSYDSINRWFKASPELADVA